MRIVGGKWRGKKLIAPLHKGTRPTQDRTRETIFNILLHNPAFGSDVVQDKTVLDLFAGTGSLGIEALSRGARSVTFVENDREALKILRENLDALGDQKVKVIAQNAVEFQSSEFFDLVFVDPPYKQNLVFPAMENLIQKKMVSSETVFVIEVAKDEIDVVPPQLELVLERISGAAKLLFCRVGL